MYNYMCAKNWIFTIFGLGAVREQTDRHTRKYIQRNKNMITNMEDNDNNHDDK